MRMYQLAHEGAFAIDSQVKGVIFKTAFSEIIESIDNNVLDLPKKANSKPAKHRNKLESSNRIDSFAKAQIFAGLQMLDLKQQGISIEKHRTGWMTESIAAYFHGAADHITQSFGCDETDQEDIVTFLITRNLNLSFEETSKLMSIRLLAEKTDLSEVIDAGKKAAKIWLDKRCVPPQNSLFNSINECGFVV